MRGPRIDRTLTVSDLCGTWIRMRSRMSGLDSHHQQRLGILLSAYKLQPKDLARPTERRFSLTAKLEDKRIGAVRFRIRWDRQPRELVYEGRDRFFNYCLRREKTIRSRGGRRYCIQPEEGVEAIKILRG